MGLTYIPGTPTSTCLALIPRDQIEFVELKLGSESLHVTIQAHESYSAWFSQPDPAFLRFTFSVPTSARLALLGRKNEPPTLTAYHMLEVISQDKSQKLYKRDTQVYTMAIEYEMHRIFFCLIFFNHSIPRTCI